MYRKNETNNRIVQMDEIVNDVTDINKGMRRHRDTLYGYSFPMFFGELEKQKKKIKKRYNEAGPSLR